MSDAPTKNHSRSYSKNAGTIAEPFQGLPPYNFSGGHNDPVTTPVKLLAECAYAALQNEGASLSKYHMGYGPQGYPKLRELLARKLETHRATPCEPENILITSGSLQAMELVNQILLDPGDCVIIETASFGEAIGKVKKLGAKLESAPMDDEGIVPDKLDALLADLAGKGVRPKYIYTIPTVQNPIGGVLGLERRQEVLRIARAYGVIVYEDECYADLQWEGEVVPSLYALDPENVIHIGSLSKTLAPAMRVGYALADWDILGRMLALKSDGGTGAIDQLVAAEFLEHHYDAHLMGLRGALKAKCDLMVDLVRREFGNTAEIVVPKGGLFMWVRLPEGTDTDKMAPVASKDGIGFNPGAGWVCIPEDGRNCLRLCFALPTEDDMRLGIRRLAEIYRDLEQA